MENLNSTSKINCHVCNCTDLHFVNYTKKSFRISSLIFLALAFIGIGLVIWLCDGIQLLFLSSINANDIQQRQISGFALILMIIIILILITISVISIGFFVLTLFKTECDIHYVCSNCGYHASIDRFEINKQESR